MLRLAYSHGIKDDDGTLHVDTSHEELGRMLGASRQSISKELKILEQEETVEIRYGKIYIRDLDRLKQKYDNLLGQEQISPLYSDSAPKQRDPEP
jgi:biotin operon repressor